MQKIRCVVERITYQNPENGYSVLKCRVKDYSDLIPVIGNLIDANVGSVLIIEGKEVFNGDIGIIESVNETDRTLKVNFDGRSIEYDVTELDELVHAYATTIHKAQGSEYPIVVMPIMMNHYVMLQRNLIYTGITRAKKALVIIGTKKALSYAVHNVTVTKRNTLLRERLM